MPEEQNTHFSQCTHAHTKKTKLFLSVHRERNTGSGHKTKLELARGGHCTGKLEGRKVGDPAVHPGSPSFCLKALPLAVPRKGCEAWEM